MLALLATRLEPNVIHGTLAKLWAICARAKRSRYSSLQLATNPGWRGDPASETIPGSMLAARSGYGSRAFCRWAVLAALLLRFHAAPGAVPPDSGSEGCAETSDEC